ncbi:MAG: FKBP-type peptidyl-prolyl cis-trans isomerase [SAR324 cluster bacterium]|nr:FKBP-type peptidyl-prolyl cis-trans isomerase [SAR324 cluster bacterium]
MKLAKWPAALILTALLSSGIVYAQGGKQFKSEAEKTSYAVGLSVGKNLKRQGIEVEIGPLMRGINDVLRGKKPRLTPQEYQTTMRALGERQRARQQKTRQAASGKNRQQGQAFLARNKKRKGVVTLPSGLQYRVLRKGRGPMPKASDTVVTHYRGTLIDGTEFDSSYARGKSATFPVGGVIRGWTEALQLMRKGAKWKLFIPSHLAYGERGSGRKIGPHAALIFDIELLDIR